MRLYKYDFVRAVAILFVVAVHSLYFVDQNNPACLWIYWTLLTLFLTGNALFFLMSGKFNLRERPNDAGVKKYYYNKIRNIMLPILIVFLIRAFYELYPSITISGYLKYFVKNFSFGFASTEYWFVFALFGYLLVAPFLAHAFAKMTRFEQKAFLFIGLAFNLLTVIAENAGYAFKWGYLFSGFSFTFCLGQYIESYFTTRGKHLLAIAAPICLLATVLLSIAGMTANAQDVSPLFTILSIGVYALLLHFGEKMKPCKLISFIAKHSFSIYLIHMMILMPLEHFLPAIGGIQSLLIFIAVTLFVFTTSTIAAALLDKVIIDPAKVLFDKLFKRFLPKQDTQPMK